MGFWPIPESYWPENTMNSLVFTSIFVYLYFFYLMSILIFIFCLTCILLNRSFPLFISFFETEGDHSYIMINVGVGKSILPSLQV